jgi:hypothetical protein
VNAFENTTAKVGQSIVTDTLHSLTEQTRRWREKIDQLEAAQPLSRTELVADFNNLLDVCQNLRDAVLSEDSAASWKTKEELHSLVKRMDDAADKRRRYLDLAQYLSAGTVDHRRERTKRERLELRDAAVAELMEVSAQPTPPALPGPAVAEWLSWACGLEDSSGEVDLLVLKTSFPRVDDFVRQLEYEWWRPGPSLSSEQAESPVITIAPENDIKIVLSIEEVPAPEPAKFLPTPPPAPAIEVHNEVSAAPHAFENGKLCFFDPDEVVAFARHLERAKSHPKEARKVRSLLAISHWLLPPDQNPVHQSACGIRAQVVYEGTSDLIPVAGEEAAKAIKASDDLLLFTGGADLLRWSLSERTDKKFDAIASIRRLSLDQLRAWFGKIYKIELAEKQFADMYLLTHGIPLLVGELHRLLVPVPDEPPTWFGHAIWTELKNNFELRLSSMAMELRIGVPSMRLTDREIAILKMVTVASQDSTLDTILYNLTDNWILPDHREMKALSRSDETSIAVLQHLGLLPVRDGATIGSLESIVPLDAQDAIRQLITRL